CTDNLSLINKLCVTDLKNSNEISIGDNNYSVRAADWSPDSNKIAYITLSRYRYDINIVNTDGTDNKVLRSVNDILTQYLNVLWSPDGKKIAVTVNSRIGLGTVSTYTLNLETSGFTKVLDNASVIQWSGNSDKLLVK